MPFFNIKLQQGTSEYNLQENPTQAQIDAMSQALEQYPDGAQIMTADGLVVVMDGDVVYYERIQNVRESRTVQKSRLDRLRGK